MSKLKHNIFGTRLSYKPFHYPWCYDIWLKHEQSHWLHTEVPMNDDIIDWKRKLNDKERYFLTQIFRFFTQGDITVAEGYVKNYLPYFHHPEIRMMLLGFASREAIHVSGYSHIIETIGMPDSTYNEFLEYKEMVDKHEYISSFSQDDSTSVQTITKNIAVFSAFTEGMQLFSSFIMLLNFPRHGKMNGMGQIVSWSLIDESMHTEGMIKLFKTILSENKELWTDELKSSIYTIATKMVELEDKFIDLAFSVGDMENLTSQEVKQYIRYIADRRLISLGMKGIFKVKNNPLPWVEAMVNAPIHGSFFETKITEYAKGTLTGDWGDIWGKSN